MTTTTRAAGPITGRGLLFLERNKRNLGYARHRRDTRSILNVCDIAFRDFRKHGMPSDENVAFFRRAAEEAMWEQRRAEERKQALAKWEDWLARNPWFQPESR